MKDKWKKTENKMVQSDAKAIGSQTVTLTTPEQKFANRPKTASPKFCWTWHYVHGIFFCLVHVICLVMSPPNYCAPPIYSLMDKVRGREGPDAWRHHSANARTLVCVSNQFCCGKKKINGTNGTIGRKIFSVITCTTDKRTGGFISMNSVESHQSNCAHKFCNFKPKLFFWSFR